MKHNKKESRKMKNENEAAVAVGSGTEACEACGQPLCEECGVCHACVGNSLKEGEPPPGSVKLEGEAFRARNPMSYILVKSKGKEPSAHVTEAELADDKSAVVTAIEQLLAGRYADKVDGTMLVVKDKDWNGTMINDMTLTTSQVGNVGFHLGRMYRGLVPVERTRELADRFNETAGKEAGEPLAATSTWVGEGVRDVAELQELLKEVVALVDPEKYDHCVAVLLKDGSGGITLNLPAAFPMVILQELAKAVESDPMYALRQFLGRRRG
jgi:hypothetical protein